jgi:hypothetical protein
MLAKMWKNRLSFTTGGDQNGETTVEKSSTVSSQLMIHPPSHIASPLDSWIGKCNQHTIFIDQCP